MTLVALLLATLGVVLGLWAHWELAVLRRDLKALLESFQEIQRGVEAAVGASGVGAAGDRGGLHG